MANTTGMLIVDEKAGTAIVSEDMGKSTIAVAWPEGFTGRRSGGQVEVINSKGAVVAHTGERYELLGGYSEAPGGMRAWFACDEVFPPLFPPPK